MNQIGLSPQKVRSWHQGQAYGQDLRDRVLNAPGSIAEVASRFGVSKSYVARARSWRRRLGEEMPGGQCNHMPAKLGGLEQALAARVAVANNQALAQLCQWVQAENGLQVGVTTMWKTLARLGLSLKKTPHAAEQQRPDVMQARQDWAREQSGLDLRHLVFLDETWAGTNMTPTRRRSPVGSRCIGYAPYGHWKMTTLVCALRCEGLAAPWGIEGPLNGEISRVWVQRVLVPALKPGDIVVMDNLGAYKVAGIAEAIQAAGTQLYYLPPYSPDYNPIEPVFAKLKTGLRWAARRAFEELWVTIDGLLDQFAADECERYIRHAGYDQTA